MNLALRRLRRNRREHTAAALILALGVGAVLAMYACLDAAVLHPLHYPHPDRLVEIWETGRIGSRFADDIFPHADALAAVQGVLPRGSQVAMAAPEEARVAVGGLSRDSNLARVSPQFFGVFGVKPVLGRGLLARDYDSGAPPVAVISERLWGQYGRPSTILGATIIVGTISRTVVGVAGAALQWPSPDTQLWVPMERPLPGSLVARLPAGLSLASARALVATAGARVHLPLPQAGIRAVRLQDPDRLLPSHQQLRASLLALSASALLLLALILANLSLLWIARALGRADENATLLAMGARAGRLVRELATEALAVAICGCALGAGLAMLLLRLTPADAPESAAYLLVARLTPATWLLGAGLTAIAAVALTAVPAVMVWRQARCASLAPRVRWGRWRGCLLTLVVAAALALTIGATLSLQTLARLSSAPPGFQPAGATTTTVFFPSRPAAMADFARQLGLAQRFMARLRAAPGITAAGFAREGLFDPRSTLGVGVGSDPRPLGRNATHVEELKVSRDYFRALGIPLQGRGFTAGDAELELQRCDRSRPGPAAPVIVNQEFALRFFPGQPILGQQFRSSEQCALEVVVGVAGDVESVQAAALEPLVYFPWVGLNDSVEVAIRSPLGSSGVGALLRRLSAGTGLALGPTVTLASARDAQLGGSRLRGLLLTGFAGLATLLAMLGLYAFASLSCAQRRREFAIRSVVGAPAGRIRGLVLSESAPYLVAGAALGAAGAWALQRLLSSLVFEFTAATWPLLLGVFLALAAACTIALLVPAWRVAHADPAAVLREG